MNFMVLKTVGGPRIQYIDSLRAVAALSVLLVHVIGYLSRQPDAPFWSVEFRRIVLANFDLGLFGVAVFFYISGFVVPHSLIQGAGVGQFWLFRIFRLYPLYWVSLLLVYWVEGVFSDVAYPVSQVIANVSMAPQLFGEKPMSGVYWTLFIELLFYLALTLLLPLKALRNAFAVALIVFALISMTAFPAIANRFFHTSLPVVFTPFHLSFLFSGLLVRLCLEHDRKSYTLFLYGVLSFQLLLAFFATGAFDSGQPKFGLFTAHANFFAYVGATLLFLWSVKSHSPNSAILLRWGRSSFSLYLLHWPIIVLVVGLLSQHFSIDLGLSLLVGAVLSLFVSDLFFTFFETYFIRVGKSLWVRLYGSPDRKLG